MNDTRCFDYEAVRLCALFIYLRPFFAPFRSFLYLLAQLLELFEELHRSTWEENICVPPIPALGAAEYKRISGEFRRCGDKKQWNEKEAMKMQTKGRTASRDEWGKTRHWAKGMWREWGGNVAGFGRF